MPLFNALGNARGAAIDGNREICAGSIGGVSLVVELHEFFGGVGKWPIVCGEQLVNGTVNEIQRSVLTQRRHVFGTKDGATTRGNDATGVFACLGNRLRLDGTENVFACFADDLTRRFSGNLTDYLIGVDKRAPRFFRKQRADRCLSAARHANKHNVAFLALKLGEDTVA